MAREVRRCRGGVGQRQMRDSAAKAGQNCFIAEIYQTEDLIEKYGQESYFTKVLKRISCQ